jgi:peptide deformylase
MLETMYDAPGIGLAAIQVGVARRIARASTPRSDGEGKKPLALINPEVVAVVGRTLSVYERGLPLHPRILRRGRAPGARGDHR